MVANKHYIFVTLIGIIVVFGIGAAATVFVTLRNPPQLEIQEFDAAKLADIGKLMQVTFPTSAEPVGMFIRQGPRVPSYVRVKIPDADFDAFLESLPMSANAMSPHACVVTRDERAPAWWRPDEVQSPLCGRVRLQDEADPGILDIMIESATVDPIDVYLKWERDTDG